MRSTPAAAPRFTTRSVMFWRITVKQLRGERTAVVIMSDGDDNKSFVPFPAILEAISRIGRA